MGPAVPLIGQQPSEEQMILATYRSIYFQLIPICAAKFLDRETLSDPMLQDKQQQPSIEDQIAAEAEAIALAAMKRLGITIRNH
jgi:hypothetical protein